MLIFAGICKKSSPGLLCAGFLTPFEKATVHLGKGPRLITQPTDGQRRKSHCSET